MKRKVLILLSLLLLLAYCVRVIYVNKNARLPDTKIIKQGDSAEYCGILYSVEDAELWPVEDFFSEYSELDGNYSNTEDWLLIVDISYDVSNQKDSLVKSMLHLTYDKSDTVIDLELFQKMNMEWISGDRTDDYEKIIHLPFTILIEQVDPEKRSSLTDLDYRVVIGTYPTRYELLVTEVYDSSKH